MFGKHYPDGFGNYIITQSQSLPIGLIIGSVGFWGPFFVDAITGADAPPAYFITCFVIGGLFLLSGLKRVPYKHYGLRTFGKPIDNIPEGQLVYEQGLHWIYPWCGMRMES